jgi:hypothetical protein
MLEASTSRPWTHLPCIARKEVFEEVRMQEIVGVVTRIDE